MIFINARIQQKNAIFSSKGRIVSIKIRLMVRGWGERLEEIFALRCDVNFATLLG